MSKLTKDQLINIAYGACFLGSGGGGPLSTALNLIDTFEGTIAVELYDYADRKNLKDTDFTAVIAIMGAPDAMLQLDSIKSARSSFKYLNELKSNQIKFLIPGEIGPTSMLVPLLLASQEKIGVFDADGIGRAVPSLTQCLFAAAGIKTNPTVIADDQEENVILPVDTPEEVESIGRSVLTSAVFRQQGAIATWPMDKNTIPSDLISGSVTLCEKIGNVLTAQEHDFSINEFMNQLNEFLFAREATLLFSGILKDYSENTEGGFDFGRICFTNEEKDVCTIFNQNENMIAWNSGKESPMVIAPDSICYLSATGKPYTNADFREEDKSKEFYIVKVTACEAVKKSASINTSFRDALLNLGYGGKIAL